MHDGTVCNFTKVNYAAFPFDVNGWWLCGCVDVDWGVWVWMVCFGKAYYASGPHLAIPAKLDQHIRHLKLT